MNSRTRRGNGECRAVEAYVGLTRPYQISMMELLCENSESQLVVHYVRGIS